MKNLWTKWAPFVCAVMVLGLAMMPAGAVAQRAAYQANVVMDPGLFKALEYRSLGFSRGGRATAVTGVPAQPFVFYFGSTGGGVWKSTDAGLNWRNISDGFFEVGSIGAVAVADSDPNVIYAGTGSACPRGNISPGVGVYKSTDAGKTWKHIGLRDAGQIGRIRIHPKDPNLVYVAVLGNIFGASQERGVYRSKDGGATWEKVLFVSDKTGAVDLSMDPTNPRILYAGMWQVERKPWTIDSGSLDGGVYKSTDAGDSWNRLSNGLPKGIVGKTSVSISPANPDRVWALIEAADEDGGLYRTDNAGASWQKVNGQRILLQRAWYYIHVFADPQDPETVYALNTGFYKSVDGGRTFQQFRTPHGDNHDLWINPNDPKIMINSNDGGANVSLNAGLSWTNQMTQPTAEIYRLAVDTRYPFRVYGAQQDNSTVSFPSRTGGGGDDEGGGGNTPPDFYAVGGGESGYIAVDPRNPDIVYAGSYGGLITRVDVGKKLSETVRAYPDAQTGQRALDVKYRFQWNAPIRMSAYNPDVLYHTSQYVHRSKDQGKTWELISPDLTRNDKTKQDYSGGRGITRDSTGVEIYDVIFAFEESPKVQGLLWAGTDDGLVQISRDNGTTWTNITPKDMPEWGCVNVIDLSAHDPGRAHVAVYKYRQNDFSPYIFQTNDYGKTWKRLTDGTNGIPANHFVRVVREDPDRKGLLYAGTEFGMYISFDDGAHWQAFQLNLPRTPVTDLMLHQKSLIVSTQGRAFWMIDDVTPFHQLNDQLKTARLQLFKPKDAYRTGNGPAKIYYYLAETPKDPVKIEFLDSKGATVASFTGQPGAAPAPAASPDRSRFGGEDSSRVTTNAGLNRFSWSMRYAPLFEIPRGIVMWPNINGPVPGPKVVPGTYQVKITSGSVTQTQSVVIKGDPRVNTTQAEYEEQLRLAREVAAKTKDLYDSLLKLREVKLQSTQLGERLAKSGRGTDVAKAASTLNERLAETEGEFTQLKGEGGQDALNFPGRLDNQFVVLYQAITAGDARPTKPGFPQRFEDLKPELSKLQVHLQQFIDTDVARFNQLVKSKGADPIILPATPLPARPPSLPER